MNIFVLHHNPDIAAKMHCDKHVVKMILESVQMLSTICGEGYKPTNQNHPCTKWARESKQNFRWLSILVVALHKEWKYRFDHTRNHKSYDLFLTLQLIDISESLPGIGLTPFAQAMPEYLQSDDAVESYRNYYKTEKAHLLKFTKREDWTK